MLSNSGMAQRSNGTDYAPHDPDRTVHNTNDSFASLDNFDMPANDATLTQASMLTLAETYWDSGLSITDTGAGFDPTAYAWGPNTFPFN